MDGMMCKEPSFQWDDKKHACKGHTERGVLSANCKICDDYTKNCENLRSKRKHKNGINLIKK